MLRKLNSKDAERMLEWMHDEEVIVGLQADIFKSKSLDDCQKFIEESQDMSKECHMAIVDEKDIYQGTVSLKMIDNIYKDAEFAIVLRKDAQGQGYARQAMKDIMEIAFNTYKLDEVYWNVLKRNILALRLYKSCGYQILQEVNERRLKRAPRNKNGNMEDVIFFSVTKEQYKNI